MRKPLRSPRLLRRQRRDARHKRVAAAVLLAAGIGVAFYLFTRPAFTITAIEIAGESPAPRAEVAALVRQELAGEYLFALPKAHVFLYPRRSIEAALRERFPALARAELSLSNLGAVRVSLALRQKEAEWCVGAGVDEEPVNCFSIDTTGVAFATVTPPLDSSALFPRFIARGGAPPLLGTAVMTQERLHSLLSLLHGLEELGIAASFTELRLDGELAVRVRGGGEILLRENGGFSDTLTRLAALLEERNLVPRDGEALMVEYIDARYGNKIYFKPR